MGGKSLSVCVAVWLGVLSVLACAVWLTVVGSLSEVLLGVAMGSVTVRGVLVACCVGTLIMLSWVTGLSSVGSLLFGVGVFVGWLLLLSSCKPAKIGGVSKTAVSDTGAVTAVACVVMVRTGVFVVPLATLLVLSVAVLVFIALFVALAVALVLGGLSCVGGVIAVLSVAVAMLSATLVLGGLAELVVVPVLAVVVLAVAGAINVGKSSTSSLSPLSNKKLLNTPVGRDVDGDVVDGGC